MSDRLPPRRPGLPRWGMPVLLALLVVGAVARIVMDRHPVRVEPMPETSVGP